MRAQNVLGKINLNTTVDRQNDVTQLHLKLNRLWLINVTENVKKTLCVYTFILSHLQTYNNKCIV